MSDATPDFMEALKHILEKDPEMLTDVEKATLRARRSYLNGEQRRIFKSILEEAQEAPVTEKTNNELRAEIESYGVEIPNTVKNKAQLIQLLEETKAAKAQEAPDLTPDEE